MIEILACLFVGMALGYLLRKRKRINRHIETLLSGSVLLLIFLLGISVGLNREIVQNFRTIGGNALVLTLAATAGSVVAAFFIYHLWFKVAPGEK